MLVVGLLIGVILIIVIVFRINWPGDVFFSSDVVIEDVILGADRVECLVQKTFDLFDFIVRHGYHQG
jgi:hypothetical protein